MPKNWPMWLGGLLAVAALVAGLTSFSDSIEQWRAATRYTARIGLPLLVLVYLARPLVDLSRSQWSKALLAKRKYIGQGFAMSHTVHLFAIVMLFRMMGEWPATVTLIFGGFAYVLLYAMAFTSNPRAMRAMGRNWKRLHRFGIHYLWLIYAQSYLKRIAADATATEGLIGSAILIAAATLRFAAWIKMRNRQPRPVKAA